MTFGSYFWNVRERHRDRAYSLRQVVLRIGVEPTYLSKIERDVMPPPSEGTIRRLARDLEEDSDLLLAMAGKVSSDLQAVILQRPRPRDKDRRALRARQGLVIWDRMVQERRITT